ncbi:tRNA uridine(34) 5-carboxymethylaminomethyl modification radical SAM/GNAT enzyme Elp3 [archaeon SCG-AAA382B04]|nr:tRNA uridine(34) 5-carboxymethylaminomethyl modification radical SAM/GNAT enzyme Elp3 [archaeon SCG-AAA382B04]
MNDLEKACKELAKKTQKKNINKEELEELKREVCREKNLDRFPSNSEILEYVEDEETINELKLKPTRSISGVHVIAVMTSPKECPHGRCVPCPGGPKNSSPQSYTGKEPAARRANRENYDPYSQVRNRIDQLKEIGHKNVEKIELIIMGGTVPARNNSYLNWFVKRCIDAMNQQKSQSLEEAKTKNEEAESRCVGMTFETRPDYCRKPEINKILKLGGTRVELGVQTTSNQKYKNINRGHTIRDVIDSTKLLKDSGLKVTYHMMPGLPGSSIQNDLEEIKEIFEDQKYKPDALKIYPTQVIEGTELYDRYKENNYSPLSNEETANLLKEVMKIIPPYVRIKRVMRDIPSSEIIAGPNKSNMRERAWNQLEKENEECSCIRCREVGHKKRKDQITPQKINFVKRKIETTETKEYFLSYEDIEKDILVGLLRLRKLDSPFREELSKKDSIVRELHVYGEATPIGSKGEWQHQNYGEKLLNKAEEIAKKEFNSDMIHIISGIGVRNYYRKFDYTKRGPYMSKELS